MAHAEERGRDDGEEEEKGMDLVDVTFLPPRYYDMASFLIRGRHGNRLGSYSLHRAMDVDSVKGEIFVEMELQRQGFVPGHWELVDSQGTRLEGLVGDVMDLDDKTLYLRDTWGSGPPTDRTRNLNYTVYSVGGEVLGICTLAKADSANLIKWQMFLHLGLGEWGLYDHKGLEIMCSRGIVQENWTVKDFLDEDNMWLTAVLTPSSQQT